MTKIQVRLKSGRMAMLPEKTAHALVRIGRGEIDDGSHSVPKPKASGKHAASKRVVKAEAKVKTKAKEEGRKEEARPMMLMSVGQDLKVADLKKKKKSDLIEMAKSMGMELDEKDTKNKLADKIGRYHRRDMRASRE